MRPTWDRPDEHNGSANTRTRDWSKGKHRNVGGVERFTSLFHDRAADLRHLIGEDHFNVVQRLRVASELHHAIGHVDPAHQHGARHPSRWRAQDLEPSWPADPAERERPVVADLCARRRPADSACAVQVRRQRRELDTPRVSRLRVPQPARRMRVRPSRPRPAGRAVAHHADRWRPGSRTSG